MVRTKDTKIYCRRYAKKSLMAFLEGGRYAADKKPMTPKWLVGVLVSSGVDKKELTELFNQLRNHGTKELFDQAWQICKLNELI